MKLSIPVPRAGIVARTTLVDRLRQAPRPPVVSVVAPAGYGKTTLLGQWAALDRRSFVWVHVDERDNDPVVLVSHVVAGLNRIEPVGESVKRALAAPSTSIWPSVVPRLGAALAVRRKPFVLVLDDVQELRSTESLDAVTAIGRRLPKGSQIALAGRREPGLPLERLRLADELLELGPEDLALSPAEALALLHETGAELTENDALELHRRTEGWAAGLYLVALALRHAGVDHGATPARVAGDDRFVTDYLRIELLSRLSSKQLRFLTRTAVLDRMCSDLCDALVGRRDSARMLEAVERSNLFLVPLDHRRAWYRYHELFRDVLLTELHRREPDRVPDLYRRAAEWCEANGFAEDALRYAFEGGDTERAARLVSTLSLPLYRAGRIATLEEWFDRLDLPADEYPTAAMVRAWLHQPGAGWAASLTAAELRLLPLLTTHLSFREIGERLFVSRNTVKTQAISIYRKLDVSSRGDAVARAAELGLVETTHCGGSGFHPFRMMRRGLAGRRMTAGTLAWGISKPSCGK